MIQSPVTGFKSFFTPSYYPSLKMALEDQREDGSKLTYFECGEKIIFIRKNNEWVFISIDPE